MNERKGWEIGIEELIPPYVATTAKWKMRSASGRKWNGLPQGVGAEPAQVQGKSADELPYLWGSKWSRLMIPNRSRFSHMKVNLQSCGPVRNNTLSSDNVLCPTHYAASLQLFL